MLTSVLESLRLYLKEYTLAKVIAEVNGWVEKGISCFAKRLKKIKKSKPAVPLLDRLFPKAEPPSEAAPSG